jgi:hypothetical protein
MSIVLTDGTNTVDLPKDILWEDEHNWDSVVQQMNYTITGALVVEASQKQAGRPVTLKSRDDMSWIPKIDHDQIRTWANTVGKQLTLTIRSTQHTVIFNHADTSVESEVLGYYRDSQQPKWYKMTIRLLII